MVDGQPGHDGQPVVLQHVERMVSRHVLVHVIIQLQQMGEQTVAEVVLIVKYVVRQRVRLLVNVLFLAIGIGLIEPSKNDRVIQVRPDSLQKKTLLIAQVQMAPHVQVG